jgi:hypothetical protein
MKVDINDIEIEVFKDIHGYYYTNPPEYVVFITYKYSNQTMYFYPISDDSYNGILLNTFTNDEIQDIYIKNPLNLPEKVIKDYYLKCIFPFKPPSKLKFDYSIQDFNIRKISKIELLDLLNWNSCDDQERFKIIQDILRMYFRKSDKAEVLRRFDCIGKISNNKVGLKLAKLLNSTGCDELYAKALLKYADTSLDTFEKILRDCSPKIIHEVYPKMKDNIKKTYHSDIIKILPKMIQYVSIEFIKELDTIKPVEWNLFGTEYTSEINLKNASIDVIIYLIDKISVKNKNELVNNQIKLLNKMNDINDKIKQIEKMGELVKKLSLNIFNNAG